jgi:pimeloyl-ACP methyl ester carboxylesterase
MRGDGLVLAGEAFGEDGAPPVLFFHGGGQSRSAWRGSARAVGDAGYLGIAFDLRGHGDSEWASNGDYLLDAYVRDVEALLGQFERPVTLVGASRGGQTSLVAGARQPERVRLVMLADVAPLMRDDGVDGIRGFYAEGAAGFTSLDEAAESLARHLGQPRLNDPSGLARAMRLDEQGHWHWRWDPATGNAEFLHPPSEGQALLGAAARIHVPVVLVRAEHSNVLTDEGVERFRALAPQLDVRIAHGVGHMFTADRNEAFAADLLDVLAHTPERIAA